MLSHSPGARWVTSKCRSHATGGQGKTESPASGTGTGWAEDKLEGPGEARGEAMATAPSLGGGRDEPRHSLRITPF